MAAGKNGIADYLVNTPQREEAGSMASDRFDYQKNWALLRLLSLHRGGADYVLLCEFHEDVTVIDRPIDPTTVTFYQIKTDSNKPWTIRRLTSQKKAQKGGTLPSILGKLCAKAKHLNSQGASFQFVTNSGFSFKSPAGTKASATDPGEHLASAVLHADEWKSLTKALSEELGIDLDTHLAGCLLFAVAELPLPMHSTTAVGRVAEFLEEYAPGSAISPNALYRTLFDELKRRTVAGRPEGDLPLICQAKGIDRIRFDTMMKGAIKAAPSNSPWFAIRAELQRDNVLLATRIALEEANKSYYVRTLNVTDSALRRDRRLLFAEALSQLKADTSLLLFDLANASLTKVQEDTAYGLAGLTKDEALVSIMVDLYERQHDEVSDADTQPKGENA